MSTDTSDSYSSFGCGYSLQVPIGDVRFDSRDSEPNQCRVLCDDFSNPAYRTDVIESNCTFCQTPEAYQNHVLIQYTLGSQTIPQYCIPRSVCISNCGPELPGCVYTGSCGSQVCFEGAQSTKTALFKLSTVTGPGTILTVDNTPGSENGTLISTDPTKPDDIPDPIEDGQDYCSSLGVLFPTMEYCTFSNEGPIGDGRDEISSGAAQCRGMCDGFDISGYEVVRLDTNCNRCNEADVADQYFENDGSIISLCIPRQSCEDSCGDEPEGCVYTGSCRSLICFYGINSKKMATLTLVNDMGTSSSISVDNSGPNQFEPVIFSSPTPTPQATSSTNPATNTSPSPSPSPRPSPTDDVGTGEGNATGNEQTNPNLKKGTSTWVWLGPILGVLALILLAVLVYFIFFAGKRKDKAVETPAVVPPILPQFNSEIPPAMVPVTSI